MKIKQKFFIKASLENYFGKNDFSNYIDSEVLELTNAKEVDMKTHELINKDIVKNSQLWD